MDIFLAITCFVFLVLPIGYCFISGILSKLSEYSKEKTILREEIKKLKDQLKRKEEELKEVIHRKDEELIELKKKYDELFSESSKRIHHFACENRNLLLEVRELKDNLSILENSPEIRIEKEIKKTTFLGLQSLSHRIYNEISFFNSIKTLRLQNAFNSNLEIENITVSADIQSENSVYRTTLSNCSCPDYMFRRKPCKHMLYLAYSLGILQLNKEASSANIETSVEALSEMYQKQADCLKELDILKREKKDTELKIKSAKRLLQETSKANEEAEKIKNKYFEEIKTILQNRCAGYPQLAAIMAELQTLYYERISSYLMSKPNPALKEVKRIRELRKEARKILAEKKELEYKMAYIQTMFPNINDIFDTGFNADEGFELETYETTDRVRTFLSLEEFKALSTTDKNQLALDRYVANRKSKWQIGRDYEMYIGQLCEKNGYRVQYTGIIKNLEDMGRDLIITKDTDTRIIQCKNWSKEKTIHEKHIFQLFGTVVLYNIDHPTAHATGIFVSTTKLSDKAAQIAKELNILVYYEDLGDFPRIKCNINPSTGEKIYHLPFDQQYDTTVIEKELGECYAYTVREAEEKGFRRAFKHIA